MGGPHRIHTQSLVKIYGRGRKARTVVNQVSVEVHEGEVVGLLGPNGAGKTTTFYMVVGLVKPRQGRIFFDDTDISRWPMYRRARLGIGYLAQETSVFRRLTVAENLQAILETRRLTGAERRRRKDELLDEFNLRHLAEAPAVSLSGGEIRRVEIARALAADPRFILLDEPFASIDPIKILDIQAIIARLRDKGLGVLITDHNVRETLTITDRAYLMDEGNIFAAGTPDEIIRNEEARTKYLGAQFRL